MANLLDVNVLVALFDPDHVHHVGAHSWFEAHRAEGWATCPLTQNGLIRVLSNPVYGEPAERPHQIATRLASFTASGNHEFWPDEPSLLDESLFRLERIAGYRQLTDVYLLGLAAQQDGRLATFDRAIPAAVVHQGDRHLVVLPA